MWKMVESRTVDDQWTIYRRFLWFFWLPVAVRTGVERAADAIREDKINTIMASTADEVHTIRLSQ